MERVMNSLRVADALWLDPDRYLELLSLLKKIPCGIGEVSLFTAGTHAPLPLDEIGRRAQILRVRMEQAREYGFSAGIDCLGTIGHHEEDLAHSLSGYRNMVNIRGESCRGTFCMNDEAFLTGYVEPLYTVLAQTGPDHLWVDDDIRFAHMPIGAGCFCDGCLRRFSERTHTHHTRETLREALNGDDIALKKAWLDLNSETVCRLMRTVRAAVDAVDGSIRLGFMTGERYLEGYDFPAFADALSGGGRHEIAWRPGGGAYEDLRFDEIVEKAEQIGRQNAYLPGYVVSRQSEIENFPYQCIRKTPTSTALEAAWDMTAGCTGAAFNIVPSESGERPSAIEGHLKKIGEYAPFYRLLAEKLGGAQPVGVHTGWRRDLQAAVSPGWEFTGQSGGRFADCARELFDLGLPECYREDRACVVTFSGRSCAVRSDEELSSLLRGGTFLDVPALAYLESRGLGARTGFSAGERVYPDAREAYVGQVYDEDILGGLRNARQAFYPGDSFAVEPLSADCRKLSSLVDYHDRVLADCCMGLFENAGGGRICVSGYYPYVRVSDSLKARQLKNVMLYLSRGTLPSFVDTFCRIRNHTFRIGGRIYVALLDPTNEPLEGVRVAVRTEKTSASVYGLSCAKRAAAPDGTAVFEENIYRYFLIDKIEPYEMVLMEI